MPAKNDITGDDISSGGNSKKYVDGWDRIFGNKDKTSEDTASSLDLPSACVASFGGTGRWVPTDKFLAELSADLAGEATIQAINIQGDRKPPTPFAENGVFISTLTMPEMIDELSRNDWSKGFVDADRDTVLKLMRLGEKLAYQKAQFAEHHWPFAESPSAFTERFRKMWDDADSANLLPIMRRFFIEEPPVFAPRVQVARGYRPWGFAIHDGRKVLDRLLEQIQEKVSEENEDLVIPFAADGQQLNMIVEEIFQAVLARSQRRDDFRESIKQVLRIGMDATDAEILERIQHLQNRAYALTNVEFDLIGERGSEMRVESERPIPNADMDPRVYADTFKDMLAFDAAAMLQPYSLLDGRQLHYGVRNWVEMCFGVDAANNKVERAHRFTEEALELVQATGTTKEEVLQLVDWVFSRPEGEVHQELGGVMTTLSALAYNYNLIPIEAGQAGLREAHGRTKAIREKWRKKPKFGPLTGNYEDPGETFLITEIRGSEIHPVSAKVVYTLDSLEARMKTILADHWPVMDPRPVFKQLKETFENGEREFVVHDASQDLLVKVVRIPSSTT